MYSKLKQEEIENSIDLAVDGDGTKLPMVDIDDNHHTETEDDSDLDEDEDEHNVQLLNNNNGVEKEHLVSKPHHKPPPCREDRASIISKAFFYWAQPLVSLGAKRPIEFDDLEEVSVE